MYSPKTYSFTKTVYKALSAIVAVSISALAATAFPDLTLRDLIDAAVSWSGVGGITLVGVLTGLHNYLKFKAENA